MTRKALVAALLWTWAGTALALEPPAPEGASGWTSRLAVATEREMVVAAHPLAAEAGAAILARGGSAVDAAIATQFVLNLVEPQSSGIGGGAFMLHWDAGSRALTTLDGRETAPAAAGPDLFLKPDGTPMSFPTALVGGRSVGVPGTLALLDEAHRRHGKLPWAELVQPAIKIAQEGFRISPRLAGAIAEAASQGLAKFEATQAYFFNPDGSPRAEGSLLANPAFAETLRNIAAQGSRPFYQGEIGAALVETVRADADNPSGMTADDLAAYRVIEREPVCRPYRAARVCGMGPPSSGGVAVLQILGILEPLDMAALGPTAAGIHALLEASKLAFADRDLYLADSDFVRVPLRGLLDEGYLVGRSRLLRPDGAMPKATAGDPPWRDAMLLAPDTRDERPGTSHLVIVDAEGNAVSMTTTIEAGFGSRLMTGGFLLNNELTDFAFVPEQDGRPVANRVEGGKRPRSSMAPTIVFDAAGEPLLLVGSPGGSRIIGYVAQTLVAVLDWDMTAQDAIAMGHVINRNGPSELEEGTPIEALKPALEALGHEVQVREQNSGLHAIHIVEDRLVSGIDPRREGAAVGR